jgi:NDP-sugar pyrophosphorylase family protein
MSSPGADEALILAGGFGTRLAPVIGGRQKVVADVAGRPFLERLLRQLASHGVTKAVLCTGYRADEVRAQLGDRSGSLKIEYSVEDEPLGTGGALRRAAAAGAGPPVLAMNGDSICDIDLAAFAQRHVRNGAAATIVALHREDRSRSGAVEIDTGGKVTRFLSRPLSDGPGLINAGIYMFRRETLFEIPAGRKVSLEQEVFPGLVEKGALYAWSSNADFIDIGTPDSYREAQTKFA